jgi:hypothetical protein
LDIGAFGWAGIRPSPDQLRLLLSASHYPPLHQQSVSSKPYGLLK